MIPVHTWVRRLCRLTAIVSMVALGACASLPDAQPFADATVQMRSAVVESGGAAENALRAAEAAIRNAGGTPASPTHSSNLKTAWKVRTKVADGAIEYSLALVAVTEAGEAGAESAKAMADSVTKLATAVGYAPPAAGAAAASQAVSLIYAQVAKIRASRELEKQLEASQPAIEEIAAKFDADMTALRVIIRGADQQARTALADQYNEEIGFRITLRDLRHAAYGKFDIEPSGDLAKDVAKQSKGLLALEPLERNTDERLAPYETAIAELDKDLKASLALVSGTSRAIQAWSKAHSDLSKAVKSGQRVQVGVLIQTVSDLRDLVRKVRER